MAFKMIDGDERDVLRVCEGLGIGDANQQRSRKARARSDCDGVEVRESHLGLFECGTDDGNNSAQMLAAGELGDDSAIACVRGDLRGNDGRESARTALDNCGGGFVARRFDGEDEAVAGHVYSLAFGESASQRVSGAASQHESAAIDGFGIRERWGENGFSYGGGRAQIR